MPKLFYKRHAACLDNTSQDQHNLMHVAEVYAEPFLIGPTTFFRFTQQTDCYLSFMRNESHIVGMQMRKKCGYKALVFLSEYEE